MSTPKEIKSQLNQLILDSQTTAPKLSERLVEMNRWIAQKKNGLLMRKRHVMQLLAELVEYATFWLEVESLSLQDKDFVLAQLSPAEQYWYQYLFPAWFNEQDPKSIVWKQKLMADEFGKSDDTLIKGICRAIEVNGGGTFNPYIADLSMATDLIAFGTKELVLCVQLTTVRDSLCASKYSEWESTLKHWQILRGLFLSFNPVRVKVDRAGQCIFQCSDQLPRECYRRKSMDL